MAFSFPIDCTTPAERVEYCIHAIERLRRLHNRVGKWYREGITLAEYNNLPTRLKNRIAYTPQINETQWKYFTSRIHDHLYHKISERLSANQQLIKQSSKWAIDPTDFDDTL